MQVHLVLLSLLYVVSLLDTGTGEEFVAKTGQALNISTSPSLPLGSFFCYKQFFNPPTFLVFAA